MSNTDRSVSTKNLEAAMLQIQGDITDPAPNRKSHFSRKGGERLRRPAGNPEVYSALVR